MFSVREAECVANRPCTALQGNSSSLGLVPGTLFSRWDYATPLPCELLLLCLRVGFGQAVGAATAVNVCTANPTLPESTGTCWGQQVRVQLSMDPRKVSMVGSGTCRCLDFGSGWWKYYFKVLFRDLLYIDWCLIWNLLLAWKKKAWKHIVNSLEVQCFKTTVLCWISLAQ